MAFYVGHIFWIMGPEPTIQQFSERYITKDTAGNPIDLRYGVIEQDVIRANRKGELQTAQGEILFECSLDGESNIIEFRNVTDTSIEFYVNLKNNNLSCLPQLFNIHFPELTIHLIHDDGDYGALYVFTASQGFYLERNAAFTDEVEAAFDGAPFSIDRVKSLPSKLVKSASVEIWLRRRHRRLMDALDHYPIYVAPFPGYLPESPDEQVERNVRHFMDTREERISNLSCFLASFGVGADFSRKSTWDLDQWIFRYGGFLMPSETGSAFTTGIPSWIGPWRGLNVLLDLATLIGQHIINTNPGYGWGTNRNIQPGLRSFHPAYRKLMVLREETGSAIDVFEGVEEPLAVLRNRTLKWSWLFASPTEFKLKSVASHLLSQAARQSAQLSAPSPRG
ncbi:hypothetical protein [Methylorubrum aminovorans]